MLFSFVARQESYSQAGRQLELSRSTVSRRMLRLENHLGVRLFVRDARRFALTSAGEKLVHHCGRLRSQIDSIERDMKSLADEPVGVVRCTTSTTIAARLPGLLGTEFFCHYPDIEIEWSACEQLVDIVEDNYDLAIRIERCIEDKNLIARRLASTPVVIAATPWYLSRSKPLTTVEDLKHHNCIRLNSNTGTWVMNGHDGEPRHVQVSGSFSTASDSSLIEACLNHLGVIYIPRFCIEPYLTSHRLRVVLEKVPAQREIFLVYTHRELPMKTRLLVNFLTGLGEVRFLEAISQQRLAEASVSI